MSLIRRGMQYDYISASHNVGR